MASEAAGWSGESIEPGAGSLADTVICTTDGGKDFKQISTRLSASVSCLVKWA